MITENKGENKISLICTDVYICTNTISVLDLLTLSFVLINSS